MELRNQTTGAVITEQELRRLNPNTSFPSVLTPDVIAELGYDPVLEGPQPTLVAPYQFAQRDGIVNRDGQWFTNYIAADPSDEVKAEMDATQASNVRSTRNTRLADCDWTQLPDAPVDATAWATYRQALRDVTAQPGFPWTIEWPQQPS